LVQKLRKAGYDVQSRSVIRMDVSLAQTLSRSEGAKFLFDKCVTATDMEIPEPVEIKRTALSKADSGEWASMRRDKSLSFTHLLLKLYLNICGLYGKRSLRLKEYFGSPSSESFRPATMCGKRLRKPLNITHHFTK